MRYTELLLERILNLHNESQKLEISGKIWNMLQKSYENVPGGFGTADSIEELIAKSALWKVVTRDGEPTAVVIYKDQYGRKTIAAGTNGSIQGKKDYKMICDEDKNHNRSWGEVSGALERVMQKMGAKPIPAKFAQLLTKKEIISYNDDGIHYTRLIAGEPHEKVIYGVVHLSADDLKKLDDANIVLHDLPHRVK